jgi:hypothetical protein
MSHNVNDIRIIIYNISGVYITMIEKYLHSSVYLGKRTKKLVDKYAAEHEMTRSSVIKLAVNEFFKEVGFTG